jgi:hypothetical protein
MVLAVSQDFCHLLGTSRSNKGTCMSLEVGSVSEIALDESRVFYTVKGHESAG